jgi:hypothetical protein
VTLEKGLKAETILGCLFRKPQAIEDHPGANVRLGLNSGR